jgi:hypothetical protein
VCRVAQHEGEQCQVKLRCAAGSHTLERRRRLLAVRGALLDLIVPLLSLGRFLSLYRLLRCCRLFLSPYRSLSLSRVQELELG